MEITQLSLWIRSAQWGRSLADLSRNIVCGNSLVTDPEVHPAAMVWEKTFPEVFSRENDGFDCVIGNPPWERMKLQEREFFDATRPDIASAVDAATRQLLKEQIDSVLSTLTPREQRVLQLRFGLEDGRSRTLEEVGREFNVTRERIRKIEAKVLRKRRHPSRSRKLKDYLE